MAQNKQSKKLLSAFIVLGLVSIILLNILSFSFKSVSASPAGTTINIVPSQTTVGTANQIIPNSTQGGLPFTINVTVTDVTDLYAWQVLIYCFPSIINVNMTMYPPAIPADNIFQGKQTVSDLPPIFTDLTQILENVTAVNLANPLNPQTRWNWINIPHGAREEDMTNWLDIDGTGTLSASDIVWMVQTGSPAQYFRVAKIEIESSVIRLTAELAYMSWGASLLGTEVPVSGNGTLCQLTFMGLAPGSSVLNFSRPLGGDTYLSDSDLNAISFDAIDGSVTVVGIPSTVGPSTITLNVDKTFVTLGDNVTISGNISPVRYNVDVKISYKPSGGSYTPLATVKTDIHSAYNYTWIPANTGTFTINASWVGDTVTSGASAEKIISVTGGGGGGTDFLGTYLPYIAAGIIVIVIVVVLLYWFKIRKK